MTENKAILVWCDAEEKEKIKKDAYKHEMNISEYIRWLAREERKRNENKK